MGTDFTCGVRLGCNFFCWKDCDEYITKKSENHALDFCRILINLKVINAERLLYHPMSQPVILHPPTIFHLWGTRGPSSMGRPWSPPLEGIIDTNGPSLPSRGPRLTTHGLAVARKVSLEAIYGPHNTSARQITRGSLHIMKVGISYEQ